MLIPRKQLPEFPAGFEIKTFFLKSLNTRSTFASFIALIKELPFTIRNTVMDNLNYSEEKGKKIGRKENGESVARNLIKTSDFSDKRIANIAVYQPSM